MKSKKYLLLPCLVLLLIGCYEPDTPTLEEVQGIVEQSCTDGVLSGGEVEVDCGGPCPPCATCADGSLNQGETFIDCGGPCPPCPGCADGIQNQGEEGIDCGGPCPPC